MSGDGQRWRVLLAEGGRSFRIEVDTGAGFHVDEEGRASIVRGLRN